MKKLIEKGLFLFGIYMIFTAYLFFASDRIEKLEKFKDDLILSDYFNKPHRNINNKFTNR